MDLNEMLIDQIESIREITLATFAELSAKEHFFQPAAGMNHPLWLLGHIATSEDHLILEFCTGRALLPERYNELLGMGSKLLDDRSAHPPSEEILGHLEAIHEAAVDYIRAADEEEFDKAPRCFDRFDERAAVMFATRGRCIWFHAPPRSHARRPTGLPETPDRQTIPRLTGMQPLLTL